jgi:hypothetical protein
MDRRSFLATTMSTGIMAGSGAVTATSTAAEVDISGLTKANIPTPALVVDLDAFEANIKVMADHCRESKCGFRPHAKTHKCPEIARRQIAAGALESAWRRSPKRSSAAADIGGLCYPLIVDAGRSG